MKTSIVLFPILIALSLVYWPSFWVNLCLVIDYFTAWEIFNSPYYHKYHHFIVSRLPDRPMLPLQEIDANEVTKDRVVEMTRNFTWPLIIRNFLGNTTAVKEWNDPQWWMTRYPQDEVLCSRRGKYLAEQVDDCTIERWFNALDTEDPIYIAGATSIFESHEELHTMVNNELIDQIEPGKRISTQMFMGRPETGTDIHCAAGVNM
jgi:hypothetical protein